MEDLESPVRTRNSDRDAKIPGQCFLLFLGFNDSSFTTGADFAVDGSVT
jgi:hypothetical protein